MSKLPKGTKKGDHYTEVAAKKRMVWNPDEGFELYCNRQHDGGVQWTFTDVAKCLDVKVKTVERYAERHKWKSRRAEILLEKGLPGWGDGKGIKPENTLEGGASFMDALDAGDPVVTKMLDAKITENEEIEVVEAEIIQPRDPDYDIGNKKHTVDYWDKKFVKKVETLDAMIESELLFIKDLQVSTLSLDGREKIAKIIGQLTGSLTKLQTLQRTSEGKKVPGSGITITNQTLNVAPGANDGVLALPAVQQDEIKRMKELVEGMRGDTAAIPKPWIEDGVLLD